MVLHIREKLVYYVNWGALSGFPQRKIHINTHQRANQLPSVPLCSTMNSNVFSF